MKLYPPPASERQKVEATMRTVGQLIVSDIPQGIGFFLAMFDFGDNGWSTYISNGQRADMVKYLRELANRLEGD